jgi:sugar phosphate isomerase/epimerase
MTGPATHGGWRFTASFFTLARLNRDREPRTTLLERAQAAANAGFSGLGMNVGDYARLRRGHSDRELRAILDDHGLAVDEMDSLSVGWADEGKALASARASEDTLLHMADVFGARYMVVTDLRAPEASPPRETMVERLAQIGDRARAHNLKVAFEFLPWAAVSDVRAAWRLARDTGCDNVGVLVDFWHHLCGSGDNSALLEVPADRIFAVQVTDGDPDPSVTDALMRTQVGRRFPGEGVLPIGEVFRTLVHAGVDVPFAVELVDPTHRKLEVGELAQRLYEATWSATAAALAPISDRMGRKVQGAGGG